jgi:threonine dehydrogenase-like Zn-dependent dehydrogenase
VEAEDLVSRLRDLTGGEGVDSVIDCTNAHGGGLVSTALDALKRKGGNLLMQANGTVDGFPFGVIGAKYVTLRPARGHSYNAVEIGLKQIASGRFPLNLIATDKFGLAEVDRAIRSTAGELSKEAIHVTVDPWQN